MNTNIPSPFQDKPASMAVPMRTNWNIAILLGMIWVTVGIGVTGIWAHIGTKRQAQSYQCALEALKNLPDAKGLLAPPAQRRAVLLKQGTRYDWRALVWIRMHDKSVPHIWQSHVVREGETYTCKYVRLEAYNEGLAHSLSIYDQPNLQSE
jgi:hypothetical protein